MVRSETIPRWRFWKRRRAMLDEMRLVTRTHSALAACEPLVFDRLELMTPDYAVVYEWAHGTRRSLVYWPGA